MTMVIVQGELRLHPEDRDRFVAGAAESMELTRQEQGCLEYVMAADPLDRGRVVLSERWESQDDLNRHAQVVAARRKEPAAQGAAPGPEVLGREITVYQVSSAKQLA